VLPAASEFSPPKGLQKPEKEVLFMVAEWGQIAICITMLYTIHKVLLFRQIPGYFNNALSFCFKSYCTDNIIPLSLLAWPLSCVCALPLIEILNTYILSNIMCLHNYRKKKPLVYLDIQLWTTYEKKKHFPRSKFHFLRENQERKEIVGCSSLRKSWLNTRFLQKHSLYIHPGGRFRFQIGIKPSFSQKLSIDFDIGFEKVMVNMITKLRKCKFEF